MNALTPGAFDRNQQLLLPNGTRVVDAYSLRQSLRWPARIGLLFMIVFLAGFVGWGTLAPLAGGAIAPGVISPDGDRKTVQHLEGGIIEKLLVRDGDVVRPEQPLVILERVQAKATFDLLIIQQSTLIATRSRLVAEQMGLSEIEFPHDLLESKDQRLQALIEGQRRLFKDRLATHLARKDVLRQRIEQLNEQIKGLQAQVNSSSTQLELIEEELAGKQELRRKDMITKPEILKLQRAMAELQGRRGEYIGAIARTQQQIGETQLQMLMTDAERIDQVSTQFEQLRVELGTVSEKLNSSADILKRTLITAPHAGTIVNLRFKTEGGVVKPAEPILDIVPSEDALLIDAKVAPTDIDVVHAGLKAVVQLSAYSSRSVPRVSGIVRSVSADRMLDETTRQHYYLARIQVDREEIKEVSPQVELVPGMPADVLIVTGERSMVEYLFQPFLDALWRSFREV